MSNGPGQVGISSKLVVVLGLFLMGAVVVFALLVIPPLLDGPPGVGPGYEVFDEPFVSTTLEPGRSLFVELSGLEVTAFIPQGAFAELGQIVLKERSLDMVPDRVGADYTRVKAVDILFMDADGRPQRVGALQEPVLLCFGMSPEQWAAASLDQQAVIVQTYSEADGSPGWTTVSAVPGGEDNQVCTLISELSLFALAQRSVVTADQGQKAIPAASPTPPPPTPFELYSPSSSDS